MTKPANARVAGVTFLVYITAGLTGLGISVGRVASVELSFVMMLSALVLGVTLYRLTCDQDRDLALLGLACRVGEAIVGAMFLPWRLALANAEAPLRAVVIGARTLNGLVGATLFAIGSTIFAYLFLRGRLIPIALAWIGVIASVLLVVVLPLQLAGALSGAAVQLAWLPMIAFEVPLAIWLIVKGVPRDAPGIAGA